MMKKFKQDIQRESEIFLVEQRTQCDRLLKDVKNFTNDTRSSCSPYFDSILCWPRTPASQIATLPCPSDSLLKYSSKTRAAVRECLPNGEWFKNTNGVSWSNYSLCISSEGKFMFVVTNSSYVYTKYEEAVMNSTMVEKWIPIIKTVSDIGYATSFIVLVIAFLTFSLHRKILHPINRLHMHLFASFIARAFMALFKDWFFVHGIGLSTDFTFVDGEIMLINGQNLWICKAITSIWQYSIIATYFWILMEGFYLHRLIFSSFCAVKTEITFYVWLGWSLPVLVVIPWIIVKINLEDILCWTMNYNPYYFLIIRIPIMASISMNFLLFLKIVPVLFVKLKTSVFLQKKKMQYKKWARSTLMLILLLGTPQALIIGLSYHKDYRVEIIWLFCDMLFGSFQGSFIALLYCFLNSEVTAEVKRSWKARKLHNFSDSLGQKKRNPFGWYKFKFDLCQNYENKVPNLNTISI